MILVAAGIIAKGGRILVTRRPEGNWMGGYWEFPGGKLEGNEDPREGLARELREELNIEVAIGAVEDVILHRYSDRTVLLIFYRCSLPDGNPRGQLGQELKWATLEEMEELPFLPADLPLLERLKGESPGERR